MDIGIGLPNTVLGVDRRGIVDWSRQAEEAGFASLGTIDRIAYDNYESLTTLAVAAGVTERVRLTTDILIAPLRPAALLAKQAATVNGVSDGRLVLGLAVGGREDDYEAVDVDFHKRGKIFDRQLETMTELWGDERPSILIGGTADVAYERAAQYGDGWTQGGGAPGPAPKSAGAGTQGGGAPDDHSEGKQKLQAAWEKAGRDGAPRTVALFY